MKAFLVLVWLAAGATPEASAWKGWTSNYGAALKQAKQQGRPLLVVIHGADQDASVVSEVSLLHDGKSPLADYVLCHVDSGTAYGKKVAQAFNAGSEPFVSIIDKTASVQLFRHAGDLTSEQWKATLAKYKKGEYVRQVARTTACYG
jgi:hypothetical protein